MTVTQTGPWPPLPIRHDVIQNDQPAISDHIKRLASNTAAHSGFVTGATTVGDAVNPTPLNGSGERGHDHSGGVFGVPLFRTLATWTAEPFDILQTTAASTYLAGPGRAYKSWQWWMTAGANSIDTYLPGREIANVWIPPCPPDDDGAYIRPRWAFTINTAQGTGGGATNIAAGDAFTLRIEAMHPVWESQRTTLAVDLDLGDLSGGGRKTVLETPEAGYVPIVPGAFNPFRFSLRFQGSGAGSARTFGIMLLEMELGVSTRHLP